MDVFVRQRKKAVFCSSGNVSDLSAAHNIGIHIYRIYRVGDKDHIVISENICNISGIAFCSVGNKNIARINRYAMTFIIFGYCVSEKFIALFRTVAFKGLGTCHSVYAFMKGINNVAGQWTGNITNTKTDHLFIRVVFRILCNSVVYFCKQIAFFKIQIIFINFWHCLHPFFSKQLQFPKYFTKFNISCQRRQSLCPGQTHEWVFSLDYRI